MLVLNRSALHRLMLTAVLALAVSACASGPVNTAKPSTGDLLFRYDELSAYLASRRSELSELQSQLIGVNTRLVAQRTALANARENLFDAYEAEQISEAELAAAQVDVERAEQQVSQYRAQIDTAKREHAAINSDIVKGREQVAADQKRRTQLNSEVARLEREVVALERSIGLIQTSRARQRANN